MARAVILKIVDAPRIRFIHRVAITIAHAVARCREQTSIVGSVPGPGADRTIQARGRVSRDRRFRGDCMKFRCSTTIALLAALGAAQAAAASGGRTDPSRAGVFPAAGPAVAGLRATAGGALQAAVVSSPAAVCDSATSNIVIHDDGIAESALGWEPGTHVGRYANRFTPAAYPARIDTICSAFATSTDVATFNLDLAVYDDDGPDGEPGTLLGVKTVKAHPQAVGNMPFEPAFEAFDVTDMNLGIVSGSVYLSVEWDATASGNVYIAMDSVPPAPIEGGYQRGDNQPWVSIQSINWTYRTLYIRARMPPAGPGAPSLRKSFAPAQIDAGQSSTLTIRLDNFSQPGAAVLSDDLRDAFPAGMVIASTPDATTDCVNGVLTAPAGAGSVRLASGASIPASGHCSISVDVSSAVNGRYTNTIPAGALQTRHGSNPDAATAELQVGPAFPMPYCPTTFIRGVVPVTRVVFAGIDNASPVGGTRAQEDFTTVVGHVTAGQTRTMAVEGLTLSGSNPVVSYIDWNQDSSFDEQSEKVVIGDLMDSNGSDGVQVTTDIHVPPDARPGNTRMRVIKQIDEEPYACDNEWMGQAEDYTLAVESPDAIFCSHFDAGDNGSCTLQAEGEQRGRATDEVRR